MLRFFKTLGCQKKPNVTDEDVVGLSISCAHMAFSYSYNFKIYAKDDKTLFTCDCSIDRNDYNDTRVSCENVQIDKRYFDLLIKILKTENITEKVFRYKKKINWLFVKDKQNTDYFINNKELKTASLHFEKVYDLLGN